MNAAPHAIPSRRSVHLVLADDDAEIRALVAAALMHRGFRVAEVHDGLGLLALLVAASGDELEPPAAVISDVRLPVYDGLDVLQSARDLGIEVPFFLITATEDPTLRAHAHQLGASAFLDKPLDMDHLLVDVLTAVDHA